MKECGVGTKLSRRHSMPSPGAVALDQTPAAQPFFENQLPGLAARNNTTALRLPANTPEIVVRARQHSPFFPGQWRITDFYRRPARTARLDE